MKYLLIDGNNLAIRAAFANSGLMNREEVPTGVHFGTIQSLIYLRQQFPDYQILMVWDGKSKRRVKEASNAVANGLIKSGYKANRKKDDPPQPLLDFFEQSQVLKLGIEKLGIPQMRLMDYETDDVIASYCEQNKEDEIVCVTTDKDYYQLLTDKVSMWNGMKEVMITKHIFSTENGIDPIRHVDVGALSGDAGDNIFGVPGWGEKTALKAIQAHGSWQNTLKFFHDKYEEIRKIHPDATGDDFVELKSFKTPKEKDKYPEIMDGMPFSGIALALERGDWKPAKTSGVKNELMALMFEERIKLAYSLKKMDTEIENLPNITNGTFDRKSALEYLDYMDIDSLTEEIEVFE